MPISPSPSASGRRRCLTLLPAFAALLLAGASPGLPAGTPSPEAPPDPDPILRALSERLAARRVDPLPPDRLARLTLEVLELVAGHGTRPLGRFTAPITPSRVALLEHRVSLPPLAGSAPVRLGLEVRVLPRLLNEARATFEVESRVRLLEGSGQAFVRRAGEELGEGRSALLEAFQVPGTGRRLMLALSWRNLPAETVAELQNPIPTSMVDLLVELVRVEKGAETTLRRQRLSAGMGTEVLSLMRLVERPPEGEETQNLEVRLTPRTLDWRGLLLGIQVKGSLEAEDEGGSLWIDHQDSPRLGPGRLYSVELAGGDGASAGYRLDVRPYF